MQYYIVGLGNPGKEYENTRHNTGRLSLEYFRKQNNFSEWREENKTKALVSSGNIRHDEIILIEPNNFMNNSGKSLLSFAKSLKNVGRLFVIYDELDLAIGDFKISFGKGAGGHKGIESIIKTIKTKDFIRIRVGIAPKNIFGKIKKPRGAKAVLDFIMRTFTKREEAELEKVFEQISEAIKISIKDGHQIAMNKFN